MRPSTFPIVRPPGSSNLPQDVPLHRDDDAPPLLFRFGYLRPPLERARCRVPRRVRFLAPIAFAVGAALPLLACTKSEQRAAGGVAPPEAFVARCSSCHGARGHGDGVAAGGLSPRPPDFRDPRWQRRASDAELRDVILHGGPARGRSALMPANAGLAPSELDAILRFIRAEGGAP